MHTVKVVNVCVREREKERDQNMLREKERERLIRGIQDLEWTAGI